MEDLLKTALSSNGDGGNGNSNNGNNGLDTLDKNLITRRKIDAIIKRKASWMKYESFLDMKVSFTANLGETTLSLREILKLKKGSIIDLEKPAGESVEVYVNNRIIGKGEVMVYEKNLAIRMNEVLDANGVIYHISKEKRSK
jgi:flagellar motor switch protein FliN/FliY